MVTTMAMRVRTVRMLTATACLYKPSHRHYQVEAATMKPRLYSYWRCCTYRPPLAVFRQEQEKTDDEWKAAALRGGLEGKWLDRLASDRPFGLHLATESRKAKEEEDKKEAKKAGQGGFHHYKHLDVLNRAPGVVLGGTRWA